MIRHTVAFTLKHPRGSQQERDFLQAGRELANIPSVRNFESLRQISKKCRFQLGFSMEFETREGYDTYNAHPDHTRFVEKRWKVEVLEFQEIDYEPLGPE